MEAAGCCGIRNGNRRMLTDAVRELPEGRFTLRQKSTLWRADAAGPGTLPVTKSPAGAVSEGEPAPYP